MELPPIICLLSELYDGCAPRSPPRGGSDGLVGSGSARADGGGEGNAEGTGRLWKRLEAAARSRRTRFAVLCSSW